MKDDQVTRRKSLSIRYIKVLTYLENLYWKKYDNSIQK